MARGGLVGLLSKRREIIAGLENAGKETGNIPDEDPRHEQWGDIERPIVGVPATSMQEVVEGLSVVLHAYREHNNPDRYSGAAMDISLLEAAINYLRECRRPHSGRVLATLPTIWNHSLLT